MRVFGVKNQIVNGLAMIQQSKLFLGDFLSLFEQVPEAINDVFILLPSFFIQGLPVSSFPHTKKPVEFLVILISKFHLCEVPPTATCISRFPC